MSRSGTEKERDKDLGQEARVRDKALPWLVSSVADTSCQALALSATQGELDLAGTCRWMASLLMMSAL